MKNLKDFNEYKLNEVSSKFYFNENDMKEDTKNKLIELGYKGDFSLSNIIDWIRIIKDFNIWVEHGHTSKSGISHDVTTTGGCHRGQYKKYEEAQLAGIEIFINQVK